MPIAATNHTEDEMGTRGKRRGLSALVISALLFSVTSGISTPPHRAQNKQVTDSNARAVITAILDEIYLDTLAGQYSLLPRGGASVSLYIRPSWDDRQIWVIYKLLPYGEVRRAVWPVGDGSLMQLAGSPMEWPASAWEQFVLTVYLDDDDVMRMKSTWKRFSFAVDVEASPLEVQAARRRQAIRARY